jgi:hypothetical protein
LSSLRAAPDVKFIVNTAFAVAGKREAEEFGLPE